MNAQTIATLVASILSLACQCMPVVNWLPDIVLNSSPVKVFPITECCSFKDFVHTRGTTELIGEEEANRTRDLLQQAKLAESGEHPIKEELEAASEAAKAVKTEASAEQPVENPVKAPAANGSQAEAMEIDSIPAGDPTQAEVKQEVNGHAEDAKLNIKEADMGDEGKESADGLSMDVSGNDKEEASITDEDVKAYWLSGITALYQVQSSCTC